MGKTLVNKVVLVTGASSGIGRAVAIEAAANGANVILLGRNIDKLEKVYDEIHKLNYPEAKLYPMDLLGATPQDYEDMFSLIIKEFGRIDAVVHCAGILPSLTPIDHYSVKNWYNIMQTNLNSGFLLLSSLIPVFKRQDFGKFIVSLPQKETVNRAFYGAYAAAAGGMQALLEVASSELDGGNILIGAVNPGEVLTPLRAKICPAQDINKLSHPYKLSPFFIKILAEDNLSQSKLFKNKVIINAVSSKTSLYENDLSKLISLQTVE